MIIINAYEHLGELVVAAVDQYTDFEGGVIRKPVGVERVSVCWADCGTYDNALMFIAESLVQMAASAHARLETDEESGRFFA